MRVTSALTCWLMTCRCHTHLNSHGCLGPTVATVRLFSCGFMLCMLCARHSFSHALFTCSSSTADPAALIPEGKFYNASHQGYTYDPTKLH